MLILNEKENGNAGDVRADGIAWAIRADGDKWGGPLRVLLYD